MPLGRGRRSFQLLSHGVYTYFRLPVNSVQIGRFDSDNWPPYEMKCMTIESHLLEHVQGIRIVKVDANRLERGAAEYLPSYQIKSANIRGILTQELK